MMLWFVLALMTAAAIFAVLWPLARRTPLRGRQRRRGLSRPARRDRARPGRRADRRARGGGRPRRSIAAADRGGGRGCAGAGRDGAALAPPRRRARRLVLLPLGAAGLYLVLGSPDLPGQPQAAAARCAAEQRSIAELVGAGRGASGAEPGGRPRLGGARAGLSAARPLRRRGEGAAQCAAPARRRARSARPISARR